MADTPQRKLDPAQRAAAGLESVLLNPDQGGTEGDTEIAVLNPQLQKAEESSAAPPEEEVPVVESNRQRLRVLMITADTSLFVSGSQSQGEYLRLAALFDELHVIVLSRRRDKTPAELRLGEHAWLYATNTRTRLGALVRAHRIAHRELSFGGGFREDLVVSTDAFGPGMAGYWIGRSHQRPLQVQVFENPFDPHFVKDMRGNRWRKLAARFVIPRSHCLVVQAAYVGEEITKRYPHMRERISVLPPFHDIAYFRDAPPLFDLRERYPRFQFIILIISRLEARDRVSYALDVCIPIVQQYPTIGVVVVGDGHERKHLEQQAARAGVAEQIVFESKEDDLVSHMKSANVLLNVSVDEEHDAMLAAAAAAGLPVISVAGGMADVLFEDAVNAFVCPEGDFGCLHTRINEFLNDNRLRGSFAINGRNRVFEAGMQDAEVYRDAFVGVFESCVLKTYSDEAS